MRNNRTATALSFVWCMKQNDARPLKTRWIERSKNDRTLWWSRYSNVSKPRTNRVADFLRESSCRNRIRTIRDRRIAVTQLNHKSFVLLCKRSTTESRKVTFGELLWTANKERSSRFGVGRRLSVITSRSPKFIFIPSQMEPDVFTICPYYHVFSTRFL